MDCNSQFELWKGQVQKLKSSMSSLSETEPKNVLQHFFLQAAETELKGELESVKNLMKKIICSAIEYAPLLQGDIRQKSVQIVKMFIDDPILDDISLADVRNIIVFDVYKQCHITIDTYFERYSSPPGEADQAEIYSRIAHGSAKASAEKTELLASILLYMQVVKRFFTIYGIITDDPSVQISGHTLNWLGAIWAEHVTHKSLSDLIWELFLDLWYYENSLF